jgi:hypothetical protein
MTLAKIFQFVRVERMAAISTLKFALTVGWENTTS